MQIYEREGPEEDTKWVRRTGGGNGRREQPTRRRRKAEKRSARLTRRGRIALWACGALAVLAPVAAGAGVRVYQGLDGNINSADVDNKLGGDRPVNLSPGSKNILVVGSDSRDGKNAKYGKGLVTMQSDTLMVLHLSADRQWATVVSLPRDSWVRLPACDRGDGAPSTPSHSKINAAFAIGGTGGDVSGAATCTIKTAEQSTGLRIDHFMSVDFQGFKAWSTLSTVSRSVPRRRSATRRHTSTWRRDARPSRTRTLSDTSAPATASGTARTSGASAGSRSS